MGGSGRVFPSPSPTQIALGKPKMRPEHARGQADPNCKFPNKVI